MAVNLFRFYESILQEELCYVSGDEDEEMDLSLDILLASYSVAGLKTADSLDFNDRKLRCAYLFLFSTSHSHMVLDALNRFHQENCTELLNLIFRASSTHGSFNITSLGGGPGSDPLGILTFLDEKGFLESCPPVKVSVVDEYIGWESTFRQVMEKFNNGLVRAHFKTQDLLLPLSKEVQALLRNTDFLSMVKFVSAISGDKYGAVTCFQRIFNLLQPGTIILIIDNAGGPDFNQVLTVAKTMGLQPILEPVLHYQFKVPKIQEQGLGRMQYGKRPQSSSTISMVILKKYGSSFSNYIEPATNYEEPNLLQARTGRSNGYLTGNDNCSNNNNGLESLPPILSRLLLAPEYNRRSDKTPRPVVSSSSGSTYNGLNFQSTMQHKTNTSLTSSPYGVNQTYLQSAQANPIGSTYDGFNYQSTYNALNYQSNAKSKVTAPPSCSHFEFNQPYFNRSQTQGNGATYRGEVRNYSERPYSQTNLYTRTVPLSKKEESKCCLL